MLENNPPQSAPSASAGVFYLPVRRSPFPVASKQQSAQLATRVWQIFSTQHRHALKQGIVAERIEVGFVVDKVAEVAVNIQGVGEVA